MSHYYDLTIKANRPLTTEELAQIARVTMEAVAQICEVPPESPRTLRTGLAIQPGEEVRLA